MTPIRCFVRLTGIRRCVEKHAEFVLHQVCRYVSLIKEYFGVMAFIMFKAYASLGGVTGGGRGDWRGFSLVD